MTGTNKDTISKHVLAMCDEALERPDDEREAFLESACAGDPRLRASVDSVLVAIDSAGSFLDVDSARAAGLSPAIGQEFANYRILEQLGEGGMGAVYLAERQEADYRQQVAFKMIRGHLLTRELKDRFDAERKILAALNHPYIARLIDGGTTDQGIPYLVMEYVDGVPIDLYCDTARLGVSQRLDLIRKVAMAVQSAHQNLVVHRDLKPSNVLVTADGIPKLLDFGIAKLLQPDDAGESGNTTVFGHQAMTPDYASPEQILDGKVTTASDVYTLGVLTYQLLAGERPYHIQTSNHREMLRSVEGLTVPRPSTRVQSTATSDDMKQIAHRRATTPARLARTLSGDLDTILLKALHKDAQRRYESVAAFSDDLKRFVDGLPVEARGDSIGYRISRFVGRHKVGVGVAAASVLVLVGALGMTTWAYLQAEAARADADQRFDQVRSIAKKLMFDVYDDIERVPGTVSARETLASTAQAYLEALSASPGASTAVQLEAAQGYARLAKVYNRQAVSDPANRDIALAASDKALVLLEPLTASHPEPAAVYRTLGQLHSDRGYDILYIDNRAVDARERLTQALGAYKQAEKMLPDDRDIQAERLTVQRRIADTYKWENNYKKAEEQLVVLLTEVTGIRETAPDDLGLLKTHADLHHYLGEVRFFDDQFEPAIRDYTDAITLYNASLRSGGGDQRIKGAMVITHWSLGNAQIATQAYQAGVDSIEEAIALVEVSLARDPDDAGNARRLAILKASKADGLAKLGQIDEAMLLMQQTNDWFVAQAVKDPDTPGSHRSIAVNYQMTGDMLAVAGRKADACQWWQRTLAKWDEIDGRFGISEFDAGQPELVSGLLEDCQ